MKAVRLSLVIMAAALLTFGVSGLAYAFHSGGVAECEGCHSMHSPALGGSYLLIGADKSSTCLSCHENAGDTGPSSYHISTALVDMPTGIPPKQRTPGGDFGWLKKSYPVGTDTEDGQLHGHNIVAVDKGYVADTSHTQSPGGTYPTEYLGCASCHDPHGKARRLSTGTYAVTGAPITGSGSTGVIPTAGNAVGLYRILRSPLAVERLPSGAAGPTFGAYPIAVAPSSYNRSEASTQTRVAYGASGTNTWGNWCSTCHPDMHSSGNYVHPVDESLGSDVAPLYNAYVKSGDLSGGAGASAYLSLVPFAQNTGDIAALFANAKSDNTALAGPGTSDKVTCLSCHRAHASGNLHGLRFDQGYEFMTVNNNYLGSDNPSMTSSRAPLQHRGRTMGEWQATYYDRPATTWASYQRVLCNKCHAKD